MGDELLDEVRTEKHLRALRQHPDLDRRKGRCRHAQLAQDGQEDVVVLAILLEHQVLAGEYAGGELDAEAPLVVGRVGTDSHRGHQHIREKLAIGLAVLDAEQHSVQLHAGSLGGGLVRRNGEKQRQEEPEKRASHGRAFEGLRGFSLIGWRVAPSSGSDVLVS